MLVCMDTDTSESRIARLERQVRQAHILLALILLLVSIGFVAVLWLAFDDSDKSVAAVFRAKRLEVVNDKGMPVVVLQPTKSAGGSIQIRGEDQTIVGFFGQGSSGGGKFNLNSAVGNVIVQAGATGDSGAIAIYGPNDRMLGALAPPSAANKQPAGLFDPLPGFPK
jgi:hypothetical protein